MTDFDPSAIERWALGYLILTGVSQLFWGNISALADLGRKADQGIDHAHILPIQPQASGTQDSKLCRQLVGISELAEATFLAT